MFLLVFFLSHGHILSVEGVVFGLQPFLTGK